MALQDILQAIIAQADQEITEARSAHQKELSRLREESERRIAGKKQEIAMSKEQRKAQLRAKAQTHAAVQKRNAVLTKKKNLLDTLYQKVTAKLASLPDAQLEPLFRACVKQIKEKGTIHPAAKHAQMLQKICPSEQFTMGDPLETSGGFLFISTHQEEDFTLEHIVEKILRPATELEVAHSLFLS